MRSLFHIYPQPNTISRVYKRIIQTRGIRCAVWRILLIGIWCEFYIDVNITCTVVVLLSYSSKDFRYLIKISQAFFFCIMRCGAAAARCVLVE